MTPLSRTTQRLLPRLLPRRLSRPLALPLVLALSFGLGACGSNAHGVAATRASSSPPTTATSTTTPSPTDDATPTRAAGDVQVVKITKYGLSFELPKGWITLDAKKVLRSGGKNPLLDELADRMGTTPEQLVQTFSSSVQTFSVSDDGARHGFLENVNSVGQDQVLDDEAVKLQLATLGAKPGAFEHPSSPVGDVTRVPYDLPTKIGLTIRGIAVVVYTTDATVVITVSSSSATSAAKIADQVVASLDKIPGTGPNL